MHRAFAALAVGFAAFLLWIVVDADRGTPNVFITWVRTIPFGDKLGHMGLFGTFTLLANAAWHHRSAGRGVVTGRVLMGSVLVGAIALAEEVSQAWMPTRTFDAADLAADAVGIMLANMIGVMLSSRRQHDATSRRP